MATWYDNLRNLREDAAEGRRLRYDPKIGMPEVAGAALPAALPAAALWDYNRIMNPAARKMIESATEMPYKVLEKKMRLGDVGLQGLGHTDNPLLVRGSEIAGGQPLGHGFVVGGANPAGRSAGKWTTVFHGGSNNFPIGKLKGLTDFDRDWVVNESSHRPWLNRLKAIRESLAEAKDLKQGTDESLAAFLSRRLKHWNDRGTSLTKQLNLVTNKRREIGIAGGTLSSKFERLLKTHGTGAQLLEKHQIDPNLPFDHYTTAARKRVTLLMRGAEDLTHAQKLYVYKQLGMDLPAEYSVPKAAKAFLKSIFIPNRLSGKPDLGMVNRLCPAGSHMCGSLPAKILKGLGLSGRYARTSSALPGDMLTNLNLKSVGIAGVNAKVRALAHLKTVAKRRNIAGVLAALGAAAVGGTGVHAVRNILEKRD